jgi:hypothetical protein
MNQDHRDIVPDTGAPLINSTNPRKKGSVKIPLILNEDPNNYKDDPFNYERDKALNTRREIHGNELGIPEE